MFLTLEEIHIDGTTIPCNAESCEFDAALYVTAPGLTDDSGRPYNKAPLCTGHAHVVIAEAMVSL